MTTLLMTMAVVVCVGRPAEKEEEEELAGNGMGKEYGYGARGASEERKRDLEAWGSFGRRSCIISCVLF